MKRIIPVSIALFAALASPAKAEATAEKCKEAADVAVALLKHFEERLITISSVKTAPFVEAFDAMVSALGRSNKEMVFMLDNCQVPNNGNDLREALAAGEAELNRLNGIRQRQGF
jgi:hypothetical protein